MSCDVSTLLSEASCFQCQSPGERQLLELALLCQIATNGTGSSGGGVGAVYSGHYAGGTPTQTPTASAAIAYDLDAPFAQWAWDGANWN